jgi:DME family drug/metabolite transporter
MKTAAMAEPMPPASGPLHIPSLLVFAVACAVFQVCLFRSFSLLGVAVAALLQVGLRLMFDLGWQRLSGRSMPRPRDVAMIVLAWSGICLISVEGLRLGVDKTWLNGVLSCVTGALAFVIMSISMRRLGMRSPAVIASGAGLTLASVVLLGWLFLAGTFGLVRLDAVRVDAMSLALALYHAAFPTALAFLLFARGMALCKSTSAGVIAAMCHPVMAAVLALTLLGESLSVLQAAGCLALTGAMAIVLRGCDLFNRGGATATQDKRARGSAANA